MEAKKDRILLWEPEMKGLLCQEISEFGSPVEELRRRLLSACVCYRGVGLSASQIGIYRRAVVVMFANMTWFMVNPVIVDWSTETSFMSEGCLSLPGALAGGEIVRNQGDVVRHDELTVKYQRVSGTEKTEKFTGVVAHIVGHEIDHLDGVFFMDHLNPAARGEVLHKFNNFKKFYGRKEEVEEFRPQVTA